MAYTVPSVVSSGQVITSAHLNTIRTAITELQQGNGLVAYTQVTAGQTGITGSTDLTGLSVTFTAVAGRRYKATAQLNVSTSVASNILWLTLQNAASAGLQMTATRLLHVDVGETLNLVYVSPTTISGPTTWKLNLNRVTGSGTVAAGADPSYPAFLLVEDIGFVP